MGPGMAWRWCPDYYSPLGGLFLSTQLTTLDWDFKEHHEGSYSFVKNLDDVIKVLETDVEANPSHIWELQQTRNGVHAVNVGYSLKKAFCYPYLKRLGVDAFYGMIACGQSFYGWRVSPKSFEDTCVLAPIGHIKSTRGVYNPDALVTVRKHYEVANLYVEWLSGFSLENLPPDRVLGVPKGGQAPDFSMAYCAFFDKWFMSK